MGRKFLHKIIKYQFLLIFLTAGAAFLSLTHNWQLYGEPLGEIRLEAEKLLGLDASRAPEISVPGEEDVPEEQPDLTDEGLSGDPQLSGEDTLPCIQDGEEDAEEAGPASQGGGEDPEEAPAESEPEEKTFQTVDETYFQDALFIGDSRTVALRDYGKFGEETTFYASKGLTIFDLFTAEIVEQEGQKKKITVEEALGKKQFAKIYIMVGINELGTGDVERFEKTYRAAIEHIRELQPDAIIYIQSIIKVTEERSQRGDYITNEGIIDRNAAIREIADGKTIFYLDVNEAVCDESGCLNPEYSGDGVHVTAKYIYVWKDYLLAHAIE